MDSCRIPETNRNVKDYCMMVSGKMKLVAFATDFLLSHLFLTIVYLKKKKADVWEKINT